MLKYQSQLFFFHSFVWFHHFDPSWSKPSAWGLAPSFFGGHYLLPFFWIWVCPEMMGKRSNIEADRTRQFRQFSSGESLSEINQWLFSAFNRSVSTVSTFSRGCCGCPRKTVENWCEGLSRKGCKSLGAVSDVPIQHWKICMKTRHC